MRDSVIDCVSDVDCVCVSPVRDNVDETEVETLSLSDSVSVIEVDTLMLNV